MGAWCRNHKGDINYIWREISCYQWATQLKNFDYYKERGSYTPKSGDLIFFKSNISHIGIVVYSTASTVYTIEGNTSDSSGVDANGGGVYYKSYSLSNTNINGYGTLPYKSVSSAPKVDYTGANKTAGLYISRASISAGSVTIPKYTVFTVTSISGNTATVSYNGSTGTATLSNSNALQISGSSSDATTENKVLSGIDVSSWQGDIDWAKVKKSGVDFAMLRICSYTSSSHTYAIDPKFAANIAGASAHGIYLGAYFFSYAKSLDEITTEANMIVDILADYPATFSFPIVFDAESSNLQSFAATACTTFCNILENNGYYAMVYANSNWFNNIIQPSSDIADLSLWQAHYKTAYTGYTPSQSTSIASARPALNANDSNVKIWQYTDSGSVDGVSGGVDMDVAYYDYSTLIPRLGLNGYAKDSTVTVAYNGHIDNINDVRPSDNQYKTNTPLTIPFPAALGNDCVLSLSSGWLVVDGGQGDLFYSLDGINWTNANATRTAGEDAITAAAQSEGVQNCDLSNARYSLSVNLSAYSGQTVDVSFAVTAKKNGKKISFLTLTDVVVPMHEQHTYVYTTQTPATCTGAEVEIGTCTCGQTSTTRTGDAALGHLYGGWVITIKPTTEKEGLLTKTCQHDGTHKQELMLPALNETDYSFAVTTAPTCDSTGAGSYTTIRNGQSFTFDVTLDTHPDADENHICDVCSATLASDDGNDPSDENNADATWGSCSSSAGFGVTGVAVVLSAYLARRKKKRINS